MRRASKNLHLFLDAKAATGTGETMRVVDFQTVMLQIGSASNANLTIKVQGSLSETAPTFSSAASVSNHWDYVGFFNIQDGVFTAGDTGLVYAGTNAQENLMLNTSGLTFINVTVTARSAGSVTVKGFGFDGDSA